MQSEYSVRILGVAMFTSKLRHLVYTYDFVLFDTVYRSVRVPTEDIASYTLRQAMITP